MLSPVYTPFSKYEVLSILNLSELEYLTATRNGNLGFGLRSEYRYSNSTSMHSLVDIFAFDFFRQLSSADDCQFYRIYIEDLLNTFCDLYESEPEVFSWSEPARSERLYYILLDVSVLEIEEIPYDPRKEYMNRILQKIVVSWCYYLDRFRLIVVQELEKFSLDSHLQNIGGAWLSTGSMGTSLIDLSDASANGGI